uniref:G-protein coupled receptors family 1 profile domain-containing protein n=1 Tax=Oryzias melastigma TaxID=30732 RepID=A0A3B3B692_ORYME
MEESCNESFYNNSCMETDYTYKTVLDYVFLSVGSVGLFLILLALYPVYSMIRKDPIAPVSLINLLISDLIQLCCLIVMVKTNGDISALSFNIHLCAKMVSISFMVVISMERYLCVAWPIWYRFNQNIKNYIIISLMAWLLSVFYFSVYFFTFIYGYAILVSCYFLFPFPLLTFFLYKTIKVLYASPGVNRAEKLRIISILSLVLIMYLVIFLPTVISIWYYKYDETFSYIANILFFSSPLADLVLYIFMRKDIFDRYLLSFCCCRMYEEEMSSTVENVDISRRFSEDAERGITE